MDVARHAIDRRTARTRSTLHEALRSLILKKDYEAITITEICGAANVARSTFYSHFAGKDDLKRSGLENIRGMLADRQAKQGEAGSAKLAFSLAIFEHARDYMGHYRALAGGYGGVVALGKIREIVSDRVRGEFAGASRGAVEMPADATPREFAVQYIVGAYMAVLIWWLDGGAKLPAERVDAMFRRLAEKGVAP